MDAQPQQPPVADDLALFCHDLRQLVAAGRLLTWDPADDTLDETVRQRFDSLDGLLEQMASMIDVSAAMPVPRPVEFDLRRLVEDCVKVVRLNHRTSITTETDGRIDAQGVPALLRRAVTNVLDNAARAAGDDGRVRVSVRTEGDLAVVQVDDNGRGWGQMPPAHGHGMASVGMALRACHGSVAVSMPPDEGTRVRIVLPTQRQGGDAA